MAEIRKPNLSKVKRAAKQQETRAFTDPLLEGEVLEICLCSPVYLHELGEISRRAAELREWWRDPETFVTRFEPVDGVQTTMSDELALGYAALEKLQPQPPLYDVRDFNQLSVYMPSALAGALDWALSLLPQSEGEKRGRTVSTSSPAPSNTSTNTRPALNGATGASGPSTSAWDTSADASEERLQRELDASLMSPTGTG